MHTKGGKMVSMLSLLQVEPLASVLTNQLCVILFEIDYFHPHQQGFKSMGDQGMMECCLRLICIFYFIDDIQHVGFWSGKLATKAKMKP